MSWEKILKDEEPKKGDGLWGEEFSGVADGKTLNEKKHPNDPTDYTFFDNPPTGLGVLKMLSERIRLTIMDAVNELEEYNLPSKTINYTKKEWRKKWDIIYEQAIHHYTMNNKRE